jgi:hypothetical protein
VSDKSNNKPVQLVCLFVDESLPLVENQELHEKWQTPIVKIPNE